MNSHGFFENNPVRSNILPYGRQWLDEEDIQAVIDVLKSDFITQGPKISEFEQSIASKASAKYAVTFSNGTAALHGACYAAGITEGDEVITSPITFAASSNCVLYQRGIPVFSDIDLTSYNLDPDVLERRITNRTKAIIPVDFAGQPVEMDRFIEIAEKHNLILIQDAAHSLGATYKGNQVGSMADMTMFSFHPVKAITTGEGGVIVTDSEEYYQKLLLFRSHGITRNPELLEDTKGPWHYEMHDLGYNYRMTDIQAALGLSQLQRLEHFLARRREIAEKYTDAFAGLEGLITPHQALYSNSAWHLYVTRWLSECFRADRRTIFDALRNEGIGVQVHYIPVYQHPYYKKLGYSSLCTKAEEFYSTAISLPIYPKMNDEDVSDVIKAVKKTYNIFNIC
ncbi:UDP-4-amino-4,6-dideoxy-N-acetyl-beta-L-altrosamine transaminase [Paenibacillus thiaminolyticus]|uniref:UDP-4-amino-4, 6-dideoxy-N-acetyl-beta-L-altrosamine transaminase n=1 Tax=Paenibacillus thiaminolyticus TaxID=49283 RepID=A0A3A3GKD8_PANTH|nr:UDP-4-amino-4,6-dideoxy-N-acetyl-beta-L-altrosamine transaminase [Paenibacillus thiaminolyticus]RJG24963.1 UDP-4-amino-4,6-dideoxy-N-acetyl-beta-L-altrosamine transaminase [Paenibacillus thiaminolyticus]